MVVPGEGLVDFFETRTNDGIRLLGLVSRAEQARWLIVHVHGYGGDLLSNPFVRAAHKYYPRHGISFLSFNMRTAAYITEVYGETAVAYVGSSISDQDEASTDIDAVLAHCGMDPARIVLQGHSFGTNIVKRYARTHPSVEKVVLLSPADSMRLYDRWITSTTPVELPIDEGNVVRWDLFGMAVGSSRYALPISARNVRKLLDSESFNEWSQDKAVMEQDGLLIIGDKDPVSNLGNTANEAFLRKVLPRTQLERIRGSMHLFAGFEDRLCEIVATWVLHQEDTSLSG